LQRTFANVANISQMLGFKGLLPALLDGAFTDKWENQNF